MSADRLPPDPYREAADAGQVSLFDVDDLEELDRLAKAGDRQASIRARWLRFHHEHPEVYEQLRTMALELVALGHERLGIRMLWEVARWRTMVGARNGQEPYRLNDHYPAHYARLLMDREPELEGVFETRKIRRA